MHDRTETLTALAADLAGARSIGFDCEADGLYRYAGRLCTLQFAWDTRIELVDGFIDIAPLASVLGNEGPRKVLHDCVFDARLLRSRDIELGNVFDTAVAGRLLGELSLGLAPLLEKHLGVRVGKELQKADWGKRPFTEEQLVYLADDVRHLNALADVLEQRCSDAGILSEVLTDSAYAANNVGDDAPRAPWLRVKGAVELGRDPAALTALRELAQLREDIAQERDVPVHQVIPNPVLLSLAKKGWERSQSIVSNFESLRESIALAFARSETQNVSEEELQILFPDPPPPAERAARKAREAKLSTFRTQEAARREVNVQVVLPGRALRALAASPPPTRESVRDLPGWGRARDERYGDAIFDLLRVGA